MTDTPLDPWADVLDDDPTAPTDAEAQQEIESEGESRAERAAEVVEGVLDSTTLPATFGLAARESLDYRDRDAVTGLVQDVRGRVLEAVRATYNGLLDARKATVGDAAVFRTDVAAELAWLADATNVLGGLADSLKAGADEARKIAGDVVLDVAPDREHGTATVTVGTPGGGRLKATRTQASKVDVREAEVVDVIVANLVGEAARAGEGRVLYLEGLAAGARAMHVATTGLVSPLSWKSTALDAMVTRLEGVDEYGLAIRLVHAYGRVSTGNPSTKLEHVEDKPAKAAKA